MKLNESRWASIIFDLDDTLYPERDYVLSGFRAVCRWAERHLGIPSESGFDELSRLFHAGVRGDTFNRWLMGHNLPVEPWVPRLVEVYRGHEPTLEPFPGVRALLHGMHRRYRLGLVSDGYLKVQRLKLEALKLAHHFDAIIFSDEYGPDAWKPSTRPFEIVLQKLATKPSRAVYVADNPKKDFLGARKAGMFTVRVRVKDGLYSGLEPELEAYAPHLEIPGLDQLERALGDAETK
jgi:putative hydrolase of the HAD superfamily